MDYESLQDLYMHDLRDLHNAEKQILRAMPKMIKHTSSPQLRELMEHHRDETRNQIERLEQIFERMGKPTRGVKCRGIEGILEEAEDWISENGEPAVMDVGMISHLQRVEHYEIAGYGTVRTFAQLLGLQQDQEQLSATLEEEGNADKKLTSVAEKITAEIMSQQSAEKVK